MLQCASEEKSSETKKMLTVLSNIVVNPKVPAVSTHRETSRDSGCENKDVGVVEAPYRRGQQDVVPTNAIPTNMEQFPQIELADGDFQELPPEILQLLDDLGDNACANVDMTASIPESVAINVENEIEAAISNLQNGLKPQHSLPDLQQVTKPAPVISLSDEDMEEFVVLPAKKRKISSSHLRKNNVPPQSAHGESKKRASQKKKVGDAVEATPSTSRPTPTIKKNTRSTGGSRLRELLMGTRSDLPKNKRSPPVRKQIQIGKRNQQDSSDSESEFQMFSQQQYNSAGKTFKRGVNELRRRKEAANATIHDATKKARLAEEELDLLRKKIKEVESTLQREKKRIKESECVVNSVDRKMESIRQSMLF